MEKTSPQTNSQTNSKPTSSKEGLAAELQSIPHRDLLQDAALGLVENLAKYKLVIGGLLLIALAGFGGWTSWAALQTRTEMKAQNALFSLEKQYTEKKEKFDQARFAQIVGQKTEGLTIASGDLSKDFGSLIEDLESFSKTHAGTTAAAQAAMMAAETLISYNQAERASGVLSAAAKDSNSSSLFGALTRMASGNSLASAGKCDQAIKVWEELLANKTAAFLHGEAALRSGLCLEKSGDKTRAAEMYRKASGESDRSSTAQTAKALLRSIEMGG